MHKNNTTGTCKHVSLDAFFSSYGITLDMAITLQKQDTPSHHQILDKTFSSIKHSLKERGAFTFTASQ
jgi:hypothetical protein